jgi:hypothetical protein
MRKLQVYDCIILFFPRYVFCCSHSHNVAPKGKFIAFVSATAETDEPELELKPGISLLGQVDEIFYDTYDRFEPVNEPSLDQCYISRVSLSFCLIFGLNHYGNCTKRHMNMLSWLFCETRVTMPQPILRRLFRMCWRCIQLSLAR